jgi:hypothetical protein
MDHQNLSKSELLHIYLNSLNKCCEFCHLIAKENEYEILSSRKLKYGGRVITKRLRKCYKCDFYLLAKKQSFDEYC